MHAVNQFNATIMMGDGNKSIFVIESVYANAAAQGRHCRRKHSSLSTACQRCPTYMWFQISG